MIFGVDFDGTLSFGKWPDIGEANTGLINFLKYRKEHGDKLILWTCREGEYLNAAVDWCWHHGLAFDAVNNNLSEIIEKYGKLRQRTDFSALREDRDVQNLRCRGHHH